MFCGCAYESGDGVLFFFFKHKTAYEMRISDWSSEVCSSDLLHRATSTIQIYRKGVLEGLMPVLLPAFAAKLRQGHALKDSYLRGVAYLTAVGWPFSVVLALLAHPILPVLFGTQWEIGRAACRESVW